MHRSYCRRTRNVPICVFYPRLIRISQGVLMQDKKEIGLTIGVNRDDVYFQYTTV